ncbi:hypothetical protein D3C72_1842690 [compost metagenome]
MASKRVDSGMKKYTINGVSPSVLRRIRGSRSRALSQWPNTRLNNSETGKNASQIATACFQRGGRCTGLLPNQPSRPLARSSCGCSNRPLPRSSQALREAECSQACMVCSLVKRKMI